MTLKKALIVTSPGLGDGLMMMVASERLRHHGYFVVTMNSHLIGLKDWFSSHHFIPQAELENIESIASQFDLIVMQHDNTPKTKRFIDLFRAGRLRSLVIFYPSYDKNRHAPLTSWDVVFNQKRPMVENIAKAIAKLLRSSEVSTNNGIVAPQHLRFRRFSRRIVLHPTASTEDRMWSTDGFTRFARWLRKKDFDPIFSLSKKEKETFDPNVLDEFFSPTIEKLSDLASLIYESGFVVGNESGIVHLASNLQIPNLVISGHFKRIQQWKPGWLQGVVITPSPLIPNIKGFRIREQYWKSFVFPFQVKQGFKKLLSGI